MAISAQLTRKREVLEVELRALGRVLVAYSGGIDSAFLAWVAYQTLGKEMLAVFADSASLARYQLNAAVEFAR